MCVWVCFLFSFMMALSVLYQVDPNLVEAAANARKDLEIACEPIKKKPKPTK